MNDFTKEELERLFHLVNKSERIDPMDKKNYVATHELRLKIQSMSDNYCDHKPNTLGISCTPNDKVLYTVHKCSKCERFYFDDNQ